MEVFIGVLIALGALALSTRSNTPPFGDGSGPRPSLAQVNQVLLFAVLVGVILVALGVIRCEAVITTSP